MSKTFRNVAVLMGGPSAEREVSLRSGAAVAKGLGEAGYNAVAVDVRGRQLEIPEGIEAVFIALHGEFGEDGEVQKLLDGMRIPYTGSGSEASRKSFDKILSKQAFQHDGVPTPRYELLRRGQKRSLPLPVVIKPVRQGSSVGVHKILSESGWPEAAEDTFKYGDELLVEAFIPGRELTVGVVGKEALPVVEIQAPDGWYDYRAKYTKGVTNYLVPAPLDDKVRRACQEYAVLAFNALGCRGFARVDFRLSPDNKLFALELNNIPGFTETSLLPKAAASAGMGFAALCDRIMKMAKFDPPRR